MAIFYCQTHIMSRRQGHSSVAAAAYRSGEKLTDERRGETHDYRGKMGVLDTFMVNHTGLSREALWNRAEACEVRSDARVAREWQLALPHELDSRSHREILEDFSHYLVKRYSAAIDVAIHAPGRDGDHRNYHAHLLMSARAMGPDGHFSKEKTQLNWSDKKLKSLSLPTGRQQVTAIRQQWAKIVNFHLQKWGIAERIDHRSLREQGITERIPLPHLGKTATAKMRRGKTSIRYENLDATKKINAALLTAENRRRELLESAHPYGALHDTIYLKRPRNFSQSERHTNWRAAPCRNHGDKVLAFFSGSDTGVFRWTRGHSARKCAFIDTHKRIESYSTNPWALAAQLALAQQKVDRGEWSYIKLTGTDEFRRRAWLQAVEMGIQVRGYTPLEVQNRSAHRIAHQALSLWNKPASESPGPTPSLPGKKPSRGMGM